MANLARALHAEGEGLQATLDAITAHAHQTIEGVHDVGIILLLRGKLVPQATLGQPPRELDALQQRTAAGPCIDAAREQQLIVVGHVSDDDRWPEFKQRATELGVSSMLCMPLWVDQHTLGTLSLYSHHVDAFTADHTQLAELYATHAALALAEAQRSENLRTALNNRDVIGQAKGILIERLKITGDQAFMRLVEASQTTHVKVATIAERLALTGEFPD